MSEQNPPDDDPNKPMTDRQTYNLVTDTITGPNVRLSDNWFQGLAILVCLLFGFLVMTEALDGVILGGFIGLLVGLFGSGIFLMIYRAVKHVRGKHD